VEQIIVEHARAALRREYVGRLARWQADEHQPGHWKAQPARRRVIALSQPHRPHAGLPPDGDAKAARRFRPPQRIRGQEPGAQVELAGQGVRYVERRDKLRLDDWACIVVNHDALIVEVEAQPERVLLDLYLRRQRPAVGGATRARRTGWRR